MTNASGSERKSASGRWCGGAYWHGILDDAACVKPSAQMSTIYAFDLAAESIQLLTARCCVGSATLTCMPIDWRSMATPTTRSK